MCVNRIECPADVSLRFKLHKHRPLAGPLIEAPDAPSDSNGRWVVVESATDALQAARVATSRMIDLLVAEWGFSPVHGYLLCSVAMDLKLAQVVNRPMITVAASIAKSVLPEQRLF